jgi:hypothetical protein
MFVAGSALAENAPLTANISVSPDWGKTQCASLPGKGMTIVWQGTTDKRENPSVGLLKKGDDEFDVKLAAGVDATVGEAIKAVLKNCGFEMAADKNAEGIKAEAEVLELFAGAKKGFLTGETNANGSLLVRFSNGGQSYDFNFGASKSDKRLKKKNIKQLEDVLTGLLEQLVVQIGESPALFSELKRMSGK